MHSRTIVHTYAHMHVRDSYARICICISTKIIRMHLCSYVHIRTSSDCAWWCFLRCSVGIKMLADALRGNTTLRVQHVTIEAEGLIRALGSKALDSGYVDVVLL